jgi:hypothetical protein
VRIRNAQLNQNVMNTYKIFFKDANDDTVFAINHQAVTQFEAYAFANQIVESKAEQLGLTRFEVEKKPSQQELEFAGKYPEYTRAIQYVRKNEDKLDKQFLFNLLTSCLCYMDEASLKTINNIWLK